MGPVFVFFEARPELLNIMQMSFMLQRVKRRRIHVVPTSE
jgi:hypothetical protein